MQVRRMLMAVMVTLAFALYGFAQEKPEKAEQPAGAAETQKSEKPAATAETEKAEKPAAAEHMGHEKPGEKPAGGPHDMGPPKPSPEIEKYKKVVLGTWNISGTFEANEMMPAGKFKGTSTFKPGPGGLSVIENVNTQGNLGKFQGMGVVWWDPKEAAYKSTWCDSMTPMGCESAGSAKWEGDNLVITAESEATGKKMYMHETFTDIKPNSFTFNMESGPSPDQLKHAMTIKYVKAGGASAAKSKPAAKKD